MKVLEKQEEIAHGLGPNLWLCWCLRAVPQPESHWSEWPVLPPGVLVLSNNTAAAKGYIWLCVPIAARVRDNICGSVTTKDHVVTCHLISHLGPCWCPGDMLKPGPYRCEWHMLLPGAMVASRPGLELGAMSWSMDLLLPGSVLMFMVPAAIEGYTDSQGCHLGLSWCPVTTVPLGPW